MGYPEAIIPLVAIFCIFGLPVVAFIIHRVLKHQERIEMIRHGMAAPDVKIASAQWAPPPQAGFVNPASVYTYEAYAAAQNQLRKGVTTGMIGLAFFIGLSFIDLGRPGPWLLGGLIPMFVGIAQVLVAMLSGARFQFGPPAGSYPPPSSPAPGSGPQPGERPRDVTPGPYAYRPGGTTELEPPTAPPERRF